MALGLILTVAHHMGVLKRINEAFSRRVLARAWVEAAATMLYLISLFNLPIANATAINLATPVFMVLAAAIWLRERVNWLRWLVVGFGFIGVLLVIQPHQAGFNRYSLLALAATALYALRDMLTRGIAARIPSMLITLSTAVAVTLLATIWSLFQGWQMPSFSAFCRLVAASCCLSLGYYFMIDSMRHGDMSFVAPFRYSGLVFAVAIGYWVWGDWPNPTAWLGIGLLILSGLALLKEQRLLKLGELNGRLPPREH
jgi:drug/metabolite transporter (DMT)-like permease